MSSMEEEIQGEIERMDLEERQSDTDDVAEERNARDSEHDGTEDLSNEQEEEQNDEQEESREQSGQPNTEESEDVEDEAMDEDSEEDARSKNTSLKLNDSAPLASKDEPLINVGPTFQAIIYPDVLKREHSPGSGHTDPDEEKDERIWGPSEVVKDSDLQQYVKEATGRFRMPVDRALYILQKYEYDIERSLIEVQRRREKRDIWSTEEKSLFSNCFFHFGKRFKKIQKVMPHRSLCSIVQYYYDTKQKNKYKTTLDVRLNDADLYDELCDEIKKMDKVMAGICENCQDKTDVLIKNTPMNRLECKTCVLYFRVMRVPRPTEHSRSNANKPTCPEYMKNYVKNYVDLMLPADGKAVERLHVGQKKEPEDDDCLIVEEHPLRKPSLPYTVELSEHDDLVDSNTCRYTRDFESPEALKAIDQLRYPQFMFIPLVWRQKQTRCMEECEVLSEEARRRILSAHASIGKVSMDNLAVWKMDMRDLKMRHEERAEIEEAQKARTPGMRSGKVRHDLNWSAEEKKDAVRCFHWYRDNFELIADVMGTKTADQIATFYKKNEAVITKSIERYMAAMQARIDRLPEDDNI